MDSAMYGYTFAGSVLGGLLGALVAWSRKWGAAPGGLRVWQRVLLVVVGSGASGGALLAFARVFGVDSIPYAAVVAILVTAWVSTLGAALRLHLPATLLQVHSWEARMLQNRWTGIPRFGAFLRRTSLRHLGGSVYLAATARDPGRALAGMHAAHRLHLWALVCAAPSLAFWATRGQWLAAVCSCAVHIPLNLLPVLHLRLAIARTERYQRWVERRCGVEGVRLAQDRGANRSSRSPGRRLPPSAG